MTDVHSLVIDLAKPCFQVCANALEGARVDSPNFAR